MFGICHNDNGGGGGVTVPDEEALVDAFTIADTFDAIVLCSIFCVDADDEDVIVDDEFCWEWDDTPTTAAAAATARADKSFLFFLLRFLADDVFPIGSTHITYYFLFFCV